MDTSDFLPLSALMLAAVLFVASGVCLFSSSKRTRFAASGLLALAVVSFVWAFYAAWFVRGGSLSSFIAALPARPESLVTVLAIMELFYLWRIRSDHDAVN